MSLTPTDSVSSYAFPMRQILIALSWILLSASLLLSQGQPSFTVASDGSSALEVDTRHLAGNFFKFVVTNHASSADYVTIQRSQVRSAGQAVLGVPTPEYGVPVPPGGSAPLWFRWDLPGSTSPGTFAATVPFKSELTGTMVVAGITMIVKAATGAPATISGDITATGGSPVPGTTLTIQDLGSSNSSRISLPSPSLTGSFSFTAPPGEYALTADATGYVSKTRFFTAGAGASVVLAFALDRSSLAADSARVTSRTVNVSSSIWLMRASRDLSMLATAPMSSVASSAFHGIRDSQAVWASSFPGASVEKSGNVAQFQALDCEAAVSADGTSVAGFDYNGRVYLINSANGQTRWSTDRSQDRNPAYPSNSILGRGFNTCGAIAFSPDGLSVAAGGSNGWLVVFETATGSVRWSSGTSAEIRALRFTPDGSKLAVGAGDWKFRMFDAHSGAVLWAAENRFWPLFFVGMDSAGTLVGAGGKDAEFQLWDTATGALKWKRLYADGAFVSGAFISDDQSRVVVSEWTFGVHGYDVSGNPLWFRKLFNAGMAATPDGKYIFAGGFHSNGAPILYLMDANGTVLWENRPDVTSNCRVQAPFRGDFLKSFAIDASRTPEGVTVKAAVACIGGTVFTFEIPIVGDTDSVFADRFDWTSGSGISRTTTGNGLGITAGYARIQVQPGAAAVAGVAIVGLRKNNILVTEAGVPASRPIRSGRIYGEVLADITTGLAIVNPNPQGAQITFYVTDGNGVSSAPAALTLAANAQMARLLSEAPFSLQNFRGTLTLNSSVPVAVIALRGRKNERGEFLLTALPVISSGDLPFFDSFVFPHFAAGDGWSTEIVLVNPTDNAIAGSVQFSDTVSYSIPPRGFSRWVLEDTGTAVRTGIVRVVPAADSPAPGGVVIFAYRPGAVTVTEAGVLAAGKGSAFNIYAEASGVFGQSGSLQSGVAVANPEDAELAATFELLEWNGVGSSRIATRTIPANGQIALFMNQLFPNLALPFRGTLRVTTSGTSSVSVIGLRGRYNERSEFLVTTTPPAAESASPSEGELVFPHFADGDGYTTQFILFSSPAGQPGGAAVRMLGPSGDPHVVTFRN